MTEFNPKFKEGDIVYFIHYDHVLVKSEINKVYERHRNKSLYALRNSDHGILYKESTLFFTLDEAVNYINEKIELEKNK